MSEDLSEQCLHITAIMAAKAALQKLSVQNDDTWEITFDRIDKQVEYDRLVILYEIQFGELPERAKL